MKKVEELSETERQKYEQAAKQRIQTGYSHKKIGKAYEELFLR